MTFDGGQGGFAKECSSTAINFSPFVVVPAVWDWAAEPSRLPLRAPLSFQPTPLEFDRDQTPMPTWIGAPNNRALSLDGHGGGSTEHDTDLR
jgi:hypothetical protein